MPVAEFSYPANQAICFPISTLPDLHRMYLAKSTVLFVQTEQIPAVLFKKKKKKVFLLLTEGFSVSFTAINWFVIDTLTVLVAITSNTEKCRSLGKDCMQNCFL